MDMQELIKQAEQGDAEAQNNLAVCYDAGRDTEVDVEKAIEWYEKAAEQGFSVALNNLAVCYQEGRGKEVNFEEAMKLYKEAAEKGYDCAQYNLALCYEYGYGTKVNLKDAIKWYIKAAEQGNTDAQFNLALCYEEGKGTEIDLKEAIKWYEKAAEQGDTEAQFNLALCYEEGRGTEVDLSEAIKWYKKAAEQGDADAQFNLALCYEEGKGTEIDINETIKWYEKAAEQGNTDAQFNLCLLYFDKDDMESMLKGLDWLVKAAKQGIEEAGNLLRDFMAEIIKQAELGDAEAQFLLGRSFQNGDGVIMNQDEAFKWYKLSAEQDYDKALNNLACIYLECENYKEAKECFERAAKQNCALAQFNLGTMYNNGDTIERDIPKAIYWLEKAAEYGMKEANEILDEIHEELKS